LTHFIAVTGSGPSQRALLAECMKELRGKGFETFERFSGESWQDLFGVLNTGGLFEEKRAFVVEGADQLGPFPEGALDGLLRSGQSTVCLLVFEKDIARGLKSLPEGSFSLRKPAKVPFWSRDRLQWLEREARERRIKASREALQLLVEWVEDPAELTSELEKLGRASGGEQVGPELVESLVVDEGGKQMLALLDGLCRGDTASVLRVLSYLRRREEPLKIISALHKRMRIAMYLYGASQPLAQAVESALEIKPYQGRLARKAVSIYPKTAIRDFVLAMARESAAGKSGLGRGWDGLELEILRLLSTLQNK